MKTMITMLGTFIFCSVFSLTGCQTNHYYGSEEAFIPEAGFEKTLVAATATAISKNFPPGKTTFYFPHAGQSFATDLEAKLRRSGYAFTSEKPADSGTGGVTEIGYKLDTVGSDQALIVLRVVAGDTWQMNRVYQRQKDGTISASGPLLIRKG